MRRSVKKATEPKGEIDESSSFTMPTNNGIPPPPLPASAANSDSDAAIFLQSLQDPEIVERVRATISNAHVFKLPPRQSASIGWRGADWKEKVWQGTVKVVERGELTAVLLVDKTKGSIFAVCPVKEGAVDRCVDSSRYFVLRIENANGRHMFIGVAFNERNDAFDFNTSLEDSRREREQESNPSILDLGPPKDYSIKLGEKIKVSIPKQQTNKYGESKLYESLNWTCLKIILTELHNSPRKEGQGQREKAGFEIVVERYTATYSRLGSSETGF